MTKRSTRRRFLLGVLAMPAAFVGVKALGAARGAVAAARPGARGTTLTVCPQCGERGHEMLDLSCPAAPRVV